MRILMLGLWLWGVVFASAAVAQNVQEPPPMVASLGVENLISQAEADHLWFYYQHDSDAVRDDMQRAMNAAQGNFNDPTLADAIARMTALDESVHGTISKLIRNGYWLKMEGRNALFDKAVWLALQHIFDPELVDITLTQIKPLVAKGAMSSQSYALMYDRNELRHGRPQIYGSQFKCEGGHATVQTLLDPKHVDERRREMGIPMSFADYEALMQKQCAI